MPQFGRDPLHTARSTEPLTLAHRVVSIIRHPDVGTIKGFGAISKTRAKEKAEKAILEFVEGKLETASQEITFDQAADLYLDHFAELVENRELLGKNGRSAKTLSEYRKNLKHLAKFFSGKKLSAISTFNLRSYRKSRATAPTSLNRELSFFSALYNHALREGKVKGANPVQGQKLKFQEKKRTRVLTAQEREAFLSELKPHAELAFQLELFCGLRLSSQVLNLRHSDLTITTSATGERHGSLLARAVYSKNKKELSVPVPGWLLEKLEAFMERSTEASNPEGWIFHHTAGRLAGQRRKSMRKTFLGSCERAGISDFRIHDLRHCWASMAHSAGASPLELMKMGGWASPSDG